MGNKGSNFKKTLVYGANYLARPLGNLHKAGLNLGHPYTAICFGIADIIAENSGDSVRRSIPNKLVKLGGAAYFSFLTVKDLWDFAGGDYTRLNAFPFDLTMAASLGSDFKGLYRDSQDTVISDCKKIGKGIGNLFK